jgi:hypothetical protein
MPTLYAHALRWGSSRLLRPFWSNSGPKTTLTKLQRQVRLCHLSEIFFFSQPTRCTLSSSHEWHFASATEEVFTGLRMTRHRPPAAFVDHVVKFYKSELGDRLLAGNYYAWRMRALLFNRSPTHEESKELDDMVKVIGASPHLRMQRVVYPVLATYFAVRISTVHRICCTSIPIPGSLVLLQFADIFFIIFETWCAAQRRCWRSAGSYCRIQREF